MAVATLSGNSLRQTVHIHCASVHQAAKLVAAFLRVAGVTAGLAESNGSLPPGLWLTSPAGWLPRTGISSGTLRSAIEYELPLPTFAQLLHGRSAISAAFVATAPRPPRTVYTNRPFVHRRRCTERPKILIHKPISRPQYEVLAR